MEAIKEKTTEIILKGYAEYEQSDDKASYIIDGYIVATLDFATNDFEKHDEMTEDEADVYYSEMVSERESFVSDSYDPRESGLYGFGY